ncbi:MAG: hypothetical protein FWD48_02970 [Oscillospiraceae bacterium]|nr:hypothetical protein [Oscillospiraceae bacterium]
MADNNLNSRDFANLLLLSPFTKTGHESYISLSSALKINQFTADEWKNIFLNELYAEPYFLAEQKFDLCGTEDEFTFNNRYDSNHINMLRSIYNNFENEFVGSDDENSLVKTLYVITGSAGCGKTTFSHKLISKREILKCLYIDFENMHIDNVLFVSKRFKIDVITPLNVLILLLVQQIGKCFFNKNDYTGFKNIPKIYYQYFNNQEFHLNDNYIYIEFFEFLLNLDNNTKDIDFFSTSILSYLEKHFINDLCEKKEIIENLTGLLLRLFFCLTKIKGEYYNKKIILFIDNIENAIIDNYNDVTSITDSHITTILQSIHIATLSFNNRMTSIRNSLPTTEHKNSVAILLSMRDSTYAILCSMRENMNTMHNVNHIEYLSITSWFDNFDIMSKRLKYFIEDSFIDDNFFNVIQDKGHGVLTFFNVFNDRSLSPWGLCDFLCLFYNNSKRLIYERFVGGFLNYFENYDGFNGSNPLEIFNAKWLNRTQFETTKHAYTHLCRMYLLRLLFNYVNLHNENNFFVIEKMRDNYISDIEVKSYTRWILLYLSNLLFENMGKNEIGTVNIYQLIRDIIIRDDSISDISMFNNTDDINHKIYCFSEILFNLNFYKSVDTHWTNLIQIDTPNGNVYSKELFMKTIKEDWEQYASTNGKESLKVSCLKVRITKAGKQYLLFMMEFEYFACLYAPESKPLLSITTNSELTNVLDKVVEAISKHIVNMRLLNNKRKLKDLFRDLVYYKNDKKYIISFERMLLKSHKNYLNNYLKYLESEYNLIDENEKFKMLRTLNNYLQIYADKEMTQETINYN